MQALIYTGNTSFEFRETDAPDPSVGENLIKVEAVGICGSDMHAYLGHDERRVPPLILGHEAAGTVIEGPLAGKRVTVNPLIPCGTCEACLEGRENICATRTLISIPPRQGAFAELVRMPSENLVEIPDGFEMRKAALAEPLAVCWHAVELAQSQVQRPFDRSRCLVIGGGAIGLGSALCLQAFGAAEVAIAETNPLRQATLPQHFDGSVAAPEDHEGRFDVVVDAVGYKGTREFASSKVKPGGLICHIGLGDSNGGLDIRYATLQEVTFLGTYCYTKQNFRDTVAAMVGGRLGDLEWMHQRPLSDGADAFSAILAGEVDTPKVVLFP